MKRYAALILFCVGCSGSFDAKNKDMLEQAITNMDSTLSELKIVQKDVDLIIAQRDDQTVEIGILQLMLRHCGVRSQIIHSNGVRPWIEFSGYNSPDLKPLRIEVPKLSEQTEIMTSATNGKPWFKVLR